MTSNQVNKCSDIATKLFMSEGPFNPKGGNTCSRNPENKQVNTPPPWVKRRVRCPVLQSSFLNTSFHCLPVRRSRHVILGATAVFVYLSELSPKLLERCKRGHVARPVTFLNVGAWTTPHHAKKIPTFKKKTKQCFTSLFWTDRKQKWLCDMGSWSIVGTPLTLVHSHVR